MLGADLIPDEAWMQLDLDGAVAATVVGVAAVAAGSVGAATARVGAARVDDPAARGSASEHEGGTGAKTSDVHTIHDDVSFRLEFHFHSEGQNSPYSRVDRRSPAPINS
jgi:hypothetical protein